MLTTISRAVGCRTVIRASTRQIHASSPRYKKQSKSANEFQEFDDDSAGGDLFSSSAKTTVNSVMPSITTTTDQPAREHFQELHEFVSARTGRNPTAKHPLLRDSALSRLITAAQSREDMELVKTVLERWRDSGRTVTPATAGELLGRCMTLRVPDIAIDVLIHRPKYSIDAPAKEYVRAILHGLTLPIAPTTAPVEGTESSPAAFSSPAASSVPSSTTAPATSEPTPSPTTPSSLPAALTLASLFPTYNLPPVTSDLASGITLIRLCAKEGTEAAYEAAQDLLASLRQAKDLVLPTTSKEKKGTAKSIANIVRSSLSEKLDSGDKEWLTQWEGKLLA